MATDVNIINLRNLPKAQAILPGNYLIVQNDLGTQIIDWSNVAILKLDDNGGATITSLTATDLFSTTLTVNSLSASSIYSSGAAGITNSSDYYNTFSTVNGIITSAAYVTGSPEYDDIVNVQLPALSANLQNIFKRLYISYQTKATTDTTFTVYFSNDVLPAEISNPATQMSPADITWNCTPALSCNPVFSNFDVDGGALKMDVSIAYTPTSTINYTFKALKDY